VVVFLAADFFAELFLAGVFLGAVPAADASGSLSPDRAAHWAWRLSSIADWSSRGRASSSICSLS
jgi:hypothetical protein